MNPITVVVLVFLAELTGAPSTQGVFKGYPGPNLPDGEVATLSFQKVDWVRWGETLVNQADYREVKLLPGEHSLEWGAEFSVSFLVNPRMKAEHSFSSTVTLEAGHVYSLNAARTYGQGYRVFFWIEDSASGEIVAGYKKPSLMTKEQERLQWVYSEEQWQFMEAARTGDTATIERLLDEGFDVNSQDKRQRTALIWAAGEGQVELIDLLIERGADINLALEPPYGSTPLMIAADEGVEKSVRRLLEHPGTNVNARGTNGQTALMYAAGRKASGIVNLLLEHGARINDVDSRGKTALDWAKGRETKRLLRAKGAKKGKELGRK